jgi:hypothetical protein
MERKQSLVVHTNSFDGALIDAGTTVGAKTSVNNGLLVTLDGLGGTYISASLAGCADFGINFCCHFWTSPVGNPLKKDLCHTKYTPGTQRTESIEVERLLETSRQLSRGGQN